MSTTRKLNPGKVTRFVIVMICLVTLGIFGRGVFDRHFFNTRMTVIPNVMNLNEKEAIKYLKEAGLKVKVIHSKTEKVPLNVVHNQDPRPGKKVKVNRVIKIWVNNGQNQVVPNIIGLELLEARSKLRGQNIQIETIDYYPSNQKYNTILGVYPKPGTKLEINQKISILVSSQQMIDPSVMPNLIGLDLNDARELAKQVGINIQNVSYTTDPTLPLNTIISTNPAAGARIQQGQNISVVINTASRARRRQTTEEIINRSKNDINKNGIEKAIDDTINKIDNSSPGNNNSTNNSTNNGNSGNSGSDGDNSSQENNSGGQQSEDDSGE